MTKTLKNTPSPAIIAIEKMYDKEGFSIPTLRRKISKHFQTFQTKERFGIRAKNSAVLCLQLPAENEVQYIKVYSDIHPTKEFLFSATSNKEFLKKLIKHNLLN